MKDGTNRDFAIDGIACRWQGHVDDALSVARDWLRGLTSEAVAGSLQRDARGRPRLAADEGDIGWSHAGGRLLLAHSACGTIGVDIEREDRRTDALRIARRYFAANEIAVLDALDADARSIAFLRLWCAKEAVLKAHGHGIAFGLSRVAFEVTGDSLQMSHCDRRLGDVADWQLHLLTPDPGYLGVLAWHDGILRA